MSTPYNPNHTPDPDDDQTGTSSDLTGDTSATSDSEISSTGDTSSTSSTNETGSFGAHSDQAESQSSYPSYGQYPSVQPQHGENQYGENQYGQQGQYSQAQYGQSQYGQGYSQPQYGQTQYSQQSYTQPQYGQFPQAGTQQYDQSQYGYGKPAKSGKGNGFFNALFDLSFSRYITVDFMRVIYAISLGLIALAWVAGLLFSFAGFGDSFGEGMLMLVGFLIFGTLAAFIAVVVTRITLEFYVSLVKTAQNTSKLVELEESAQRSTTQR